MNHRSNYSWHHEFIKTIYPIWQSLKNVDLWRNSYVLLELNKHIINIAFATFMRHHNSWVEKTSIGSKQFESIFNFNISSKIAKTSNEQKYRLFSFLRSIPWSHIVKISHMCSHTSILLSMEIISITFLCVRNVYTLYCSYRYASDDIYCHYF